MTQSPAADAPADQPTVPSSTGDRFIDEALQSTAALDDREVAEHPAAFEHVHRVLRDSLAGTRPAPTDGHRE